MSNCLYLFIADCHCHDEDCVLDLGEWKCTSWTCDRGWQNAPYCNKGKFTHVCIQLQFVYELEGIKMLPSTGIKIIVIFLVLVM